MKTKVYLPQKLSSAQKQRMFSIMQEYYDNVVWEEFLRDLSEKQKVMTVINSEGEIQGFSTIHEFTFADPRNPEKKMVGVFSGDTVLDRKYWNNGSLAAGMGKYMLKLKLKNPHRQVFWFLISKGYKTYLLLTNNFISYSPRHDAPVKVDHQRFMDFYYGKKFGTRYLPKKGIVLPCENGMKVKVAVADIDHSLLENPNIAFFQNKNPRWQEGTELACIAEISVEVPIRFFIKRLKRTLGLQRMQTASATG